MSGICGWLNTQQSTDIHLEATLDAMASALRYHPDMEANTTHNTEGALIAVGLHKLARIHADDAGMAAIYGNLWFDDASMKQFIHEHGLAKAVLHAYQKSGAEFLQKIRGQFVIAIYLFEEKKFILATDRTGTCPLYYYNKDGLIAYGSNVKSVVAHPRVEKEINPQSIFNYLYFHAVPSPDSIYLNCHRLLQGQYLEYHQGNINLDSYWQLDYRREKEKMGVEDLRDELFSVLRNSTRQECIDVNLGAFLSGGTDSSTVTGMLGTVTNKPTQCFSIGFDQEGFDEIKYARISAKHFRAIHHEYYVTPQDVFDAIPKIAQSYGEPFGNSSAVPTYYCALLARNEGIGKLLAGDGGDELFAGNERYAKQLLFEKYFGIPGFFRRALLEPLFLSGLGDIGPLTKIKSYINQANTPLPARMERYNHMQRTGEEKIVHPKLLSIVDPQNPLGLLKQVYDDADCNTVLNHMLAVDYKFTLADNDLRKVTSMCHLAGVEVGFPLLSDRMVDFSSAIPADLKLHDGKLRFFFKEALRKYLPQEVLTKPKQGFGLPYGHWLKDFKPLNEMTRDSLSNLKIREVVNPEYIDDLVDVQLEEHTDYYGPMIWVLMMLEQWFQHHVD